ncbi:ParB/RepB/Spo0J family partition protein [Granulicella sp. WH15]|uniref:ParB/RepB/Spo0J family partition protein n=1 Tax=Granulicella sp. WH15 TaxID=2602070 RepID=UPI001366ED9A|nr:ParB/RepB/Spo0J family partition protein [Granulicella sp. WH15]QHN04735.1 ParB/RepB/Spo0J family partition protein [Granulicella sp. WH15]
MNTTVINATEYRNLPLALLTESTTNPRRIFEDAALKELAESIRTQGVLSPLLVRPLNERGFEIVAGARRYRAAQMAEAETVPVRIVNLTDAETLEAQLVENLMRRDVHPMEEASGFRALLNLDEPKYSIEQISARTGKNPAYVAARVKLTELAPIVVEAFYREEIGVGHALLLAKLQPDQQEQALAACFKQDWSAGGEKPKRILLPVRSLQFWIESNILLILKLAPFDKRDGQLVPAAGSCVDCPMRTGHNKLLFSDLGKLDACTSPSCYQAKVDAHVAKTIATKPKLVQISTAYGQQKEGSATLPRNQYVEVRPEKPATKEEATRPEFKTCKYTTEAIVSEGIDKGQLRKVCTEPTCPVHHPKQRPQKVADDTKWKAEQEKQRREAAISNATGIRILAAITAAVPVRLMKRDLLFVVERLASLLDENRLAVVAKQHGIKKAKDSDSIGKLFAAYVRRAEENVLGRVLVELTILHAATRQNAALVLRDAATVYKVDTDAIALKVKQEFAAKEKVQSVKKPVTKTPPKAAKKAKAA